MKKFYLLAAIGLIVCDGIIYGLYSHSLAQSEKDKRYYDEVMVDIDAAFERAKAQPEDNSVDEDKIEYKVTENDDPVEPKKVYSQETQEYFNQIALKTELDGDLKDVHIWTTDMKIFVAGEKPDYLMNELRRVVNELNNIIDPIDIKIVSNKKESNYVIYFGSHVDFKNKYTLYAPQRLNNNWGYFETKNNSGLMYSGLMYVDLYRNNDEVSHKHLLREELTQSLGLFNDSWDYPESIFYQGWTTTTEFAPIDRELIEMLYNN